MSLKEFTSSPGTSYQPKPKNYYRDEDYMNCSLAEINLELDNNSKIISYVVNEIIFLLGKRKNLTNAKRRKIKEEMEEKIMEAKNSSEHSF